MKKTLLVAAATLFVIGQALAQGQTPAPSGQTPNPRAGQQQNQQGQQTQQTQQTQSKQQKTTTGFGGGQPQMQSGAFPTKLTCKKGQKPDGITCM